MYSALFKKKVDCPNFDTCHRREDLTTSSIVVSQAIQKYIWFATPSSQNKKDIGARIPIWITRYIIWMGDKRCVRATKFPVYKFTVQVDIIVDITHLYKYWVIQNSRNNSMRQCQFMLENNEKK
jgi:hypothetical protein